MSARRKTTERVALLGASGYIGNQFSRELAARRIANKSVIRGVYTNSILMRRLISEWRPTLVINCAAFIPATGVDACEDDKVQTIKANLILPAMLANLCCEAGVELMHISSGCFYNGDNDGKGWTENDPPQLSFQTKCGVYVGCKQMAEEAVSQCQSYICRIRLPFDEFDHPRNLISKLQGFVVISNETQSLTHRGDAVKACLDLWQLRAPLGIYNCTNPGAVNYRDLCERINRKLHGNAKRMKFVEPWQFDQTIARTPKSRCVLNCDKLLATGVKLRPVGEAIDESLEKWTKG